MTEKFVCKTISEKHCINFKSTTFNACEQFGETVVKGRLAK